jgi:8-oxo-dGTP pyrophosphatase MutT (NUDIX family)
MKKRKKDRRNDAKRMTSRNSQLAGHESVRHKFNMTDSAKGRAPILAAGGIVLRGNASPRFAVVRLRREKAWVLPKGKLMAREHPRDAAKREVLEETGYDVSVHKFLGSMSYAVQGRIKIVQFWLMRAAGAPVRELMDDVKAVKWLPLRKAIDVLNRPHEKVFLTHVGPIALDAARKSMRGNLRKSVRDNLRKPVAKKPKPSARGRDRADSNTFVRAVGRLFGRVADSSARRAG